MAGKSVLRSIKNVTSGYSSAQILVRECTSNDPASPTITMMSEIADLTYKNGSFQDAIDILDKRLNDKGKNWRHVAKALTLLDYLVRYGSDDVIIWAKDNLYIIKTLREFNVRDSQGNDQGSIIRVKAKELTSLLQDDERLKQERDAAQKSGNRGRRRRGGFRRGGSRSLTDDNEVYDEDLARALEKSRETADEEERKRREQSDESLERAIQLSLEEEEMRKKNQNLLNLNDESNAPDVFGFYEQQQQQQQQNQGQIVGYDMFGNPIYANQPMATGYLQNAYQDFANQQLAAQQLAAQQQALYLQQQQALYQQQLNAAANAQIPMQTGSNNPFGQQQLMLQQQQQQEEQERQRQEQLLMLQKQKEAEEEAKRREEELKKQQLLLQQQQQQLLEQQQRVQQLQQQASQSPIKPTITGSQKMNQQYSQLNQLLAEGTGIDTFGNTGDARISAQFTKTGNFINSQGTGFKQVSSQGNPFLDTQFTGIGVTAPAASTIVPAETGYGFGNQQLQRNTNNTNSLIDL
ncbi:hypothetical protein C6P40_000011 [Pichia californica]|uniref:ENTH domain-containing protein n=1 Tax=Pichia californica TaxID=460514 RepID=A0A9P6WQI9_9ASCO|nr:hypothetical protein C6P42_003528 [[Candida] californica]KAG0691394.1 hypothetical protein C6P40_000011 [[Candida] californica]